MRPAKAFAHLKCEGYRNVNELIDTIDDQLHPGESLYGDWNAELLVLGQDSMDWGTFEALFAKEGRGAYRHGDNPTNRSIGRALAVYLHRRSGSATEYSNRNCGVFYGNAIWLMKTTPGMRGYLPNLQAVKDVCKPVFAATVDGLSRLKAVWAMGDVSYGFLQDAAGGTLLSDWDTAKAEVQIGQFCHRQLAVFATEHGSRASSDFADRVNDRLQQIGLADAAHR
jgi:hypothetical protein